MKRLLLIALFSLTTPLLTLAQTPAASGGQQTAQGFIQNFVLFLNGTIVPFMLGIAFVIFVINVIRFFVFQSNNEDGQKAAKSLALYSILAFVIIIIFWGIVNLLVSTFGLATGGPPTSDYVDKEQQPGTVPPPTTNSNSNAAPANPTTPAPGPGRDVPPGAFTPPVDWPNTPPPITDELNGDPGPPQFMDNNLDGGPGRATFQ